MLIVPKLRIADVLGLQFQEVIARASGSCSLGIYEFRNHFLMPEAICSCFREWKDQVAGAVTVQGIPNPHIL